MTLQTPPPDVELSALTILVSSLRDELRESGELNDVLRAENRRLVAALAVERAAHNPDAVEAAHRELHDANYRISRLMRVFDAVRVERPPMRVAADDFVTDAFLDDLAKVVGERGVRTSGLARVHEEVSVHWKEGEQEQNWNGKEGEREKGKVGEREEDEVALETNAIAEEVAVSTGENFRGDGDKRDEGLRSTSVPFKHGMTSQAGVDMNQSSNGVSGGDEDGKTGTKGDKIVSAARGVEDLVGSVDQNEDAAKDGMLPTQSITVEKSSGATRPILVDESNPAAECLRLLIGASSVEVHDSRRVLITMDNTTRNRQLCFWVAWNHEQIEYKQKAINLELECRPDFLHEPAIRFDTSQGPNFMVLIMGAMFDFTVQPKTCSP